MKMDCFSITLLKVFLFCFSLGYSRDEDSNLVAIIDGTQLSNQFKETEFIDHNRINNLD